MNNLSSYCGLVDAKIRASDKDLPVQFDFLEYIQKQNFKIYITLAGQQEKAHKRQWAPSLFIVALLW